MLDSTRQILSNFPCLWWFDRLIRRPTGVEESDAVGRVNADWSGAARHLSAGGATACGERHGNGRLFPEKSLLDCDFVCVFGQISDWNCAEWTLMDRWWIIDERAATLKLSWPVNEFPPECFSLITIVRGNWSRISRRRSLPENHRRFHWRMFPSQQFQIMAGSTMADLRNIPDLIWNDIKTICKEKRKLWGNIGGVLAEEFQRNLVAINGVMVIMNRSKFMQLIADLEIGVLIMGGVGSPARLARRYLHKWRWFLSRRITASISESKVLTESFKCPKNRLTMRPKCVQKVSQMRPKSCPKCV